MSTIHKAACVTLIGLSLITSACTHADTPPPAVDVRIQRVEVPVPQPCLAKDKIPDAPPKIAGLLNGDARHDLDLVSASALRLRAWGEAMQAALKACAG